MDWIITLETTFEGVRTVSTQIFIYNVAINSFELVHTLLNSTDNIFIADWGDQRGLNIIYYNETTKTRQYLVFNKDGTVSIHEFKSWISLNLNLCNASGSYNELPMLSPNSNAYIDMDGDCINDILITSINDKGSRFLEIWKGIIENNTIKYCLTTSNVYSLDSNLGMFSVVDVDRNAMPDLVFPIVSSSPPKILIAYNKWPIEFDWTDDYCSTHSPVSITSDSTSADKVNIPVIFDSFQIGFSTNTVATITIFEDNDYTFYSDSQWYPLYLRFIDINQDSYPDFSTVLYNKVSKSRTPFIFISEPIIYSNSNTLPRRKFSQDSVIYLPSVSNAVVVTFFDFEDNGKMDLIILDDTNNTINTYGFLNMNVYDSYIMKSFVSSFWNCFYCHEIGATQRFITTNIDGTRRMDYSIQAAQDGVLGGLIAPFGYIGIGRSNNYWENFHIISGNYPKGNDNFKIYTPVIPNSQLVIFHDQRPDSSDTTWKVDWIVTPTKNWKWIIFVIVLMIIIMTTVSTYLRAKEQEEDTWENKETFKFWFG